MKKTTLYGHQLYEALREVEVSNPGVACRAGRPGQAKSDGVLL